MTLSFVRLIPVRLEMLSCSMAAGVSLDRETLSNRALLALLASPFGGFCAESGAAQRLEKVFVHGVH